MQTMTNIGALLSALEEPNAKILARYPGESGKRQPVHTVYGGAHLFSADLPKKMGGLAEAALFHHGRDAKRFGKILGISESLAERVWDRVLEKLRREPVEDYRIDFEDGYGNRCDEEEDRHAQEAADHVAEAKARGVLPPYFGIRIKPLSNEFAPRSLRTLDRFVTRLAQRKALPSPFLVTLPKITSPFQVEVLARALAHLEENLGLPSRSLQIECMVEITQSILSEDGTCPLAAYIPRAAGRLFAAHFGTYDYTASCQIAAKDQHMMHPACDFAKHMMQVAFSGTGVFLSDGATNMMPVGPHKMGAGGKTLTTVELTENDATVHAAWRLMYAHVRHSLETGFFQGWDLHPAQLPVRYAAVHTFFLEGLEEATRRLKNFLDKAAQATRVGEIFDDAATGQGLLNYFLRGMSAGAITEAEAEATGITKPEFIGRSFAAILKNRRESQLPR